MLYTAPSALREDHRGVAFALQVIIDPLVCALLLVAFVGLVQAGNLAGRSRTFAILVAALGAAALSQLIAVPLLAAQFWTKATLPVTTLVWANIGSMAMMCVGAAMVIDHHVQARSRGAALREARLRAADVVRRTAEVRLQAARARVEPQFLFDALSAVERAYEADVATGNRLLDDIVTYLRAVMPDLSEVAAAEGREAEIARLRLDIERAIAGAPA